MKRQHLIMIVRSNVLSRKEIYSLLKVDPTLTMISSVPSKQLTHKLNIPLHLAKKIIQIFKDEKLKEEIKKDEEQYSIITIFDKHYSRLLREINDAPLVLYCLGDLSLLNKQRIISVIGTRQPTSNAWHKLELITTPMIDDDWVIVSGLARGIDSFAHQLTLMNEGHTIAVLGHGFNYIYPKENLGLFNLIKNRGLIITEYPPYTPPRKFQFPERNRIISGLSFATLVIEAKIRSGTLITVNQALDQGRDVYAVPDSPLLKEAEGCHELIRDGAIITTSSKDIMNDWPKSRQLSFL